MDGRETRLREPPKQRCCCGLYQVTIHEPFMVNDIVHEALGPAGNFCGPLSAHTIRELRAKVEELQQLVAYKDEITERGWYLSRMIYMDGEASDWELFVTSPEEERQCLRPDDSKREYIGPLDKLLRLK